MDSSKISKYSFLISSQPMLALFVQEMLEKNEAMFRGYKLEGAVHSINLRSSEGTGCEIDVYAELSKKEGKKKTKTAFLAETKNQKTIISLDVAKKFIASVARAKSEYKLKDVSLMFICTAGFRKNAKDYLESFSAVCSTTFPPTGI